MSNTIDIIAIERDVKARLETVCDNVYINNAPRAVPEHLQSYIIADVCNGISYRGTYKDSSVYFYVYVRNRKSDVQNSVKINELVNDVVALLPIVTDKISITTPNITLGVRENDFTRSVIRCEALLK